MREKYSEDEYVEYLLNGTNWNINKGKLKELIRENLNIPVNGTMNIIKKLKINYNLILLSDHVKEWMEYILKNNKEINIFEHKYFSYIYGKLKADPGCFQYVLETMHIEANETIVIDDYKSNIEVANKNGIQGIIFRDAKQLEKELTKRSIL